MFPNETQQQLLILTIAIRFLRILLRFRVKSWWDLSSNSYTCPSYICSQTGSYGWSRIGKVLATIDLFDWLLIAWNGSLLLLHLNFCSVLMTTVRVLKNNISYAAYCD